MRRLAAVALALGAVLLCAAGVARADGDPASDYLYTQKVFLPYDANIAQADQRKLVAAVRSATEQGFPIRVALIASSYDLGSVTVLWKRPRTYARFLGAELEFLYKGRLLIVMPNGFGFNRPKHGTAAEYALLSKIPIGPTPDGLAEAATTAVRKLAAANGITVSTVLKGKTPAQQNAHDRVVIVVAVLVALLLGGALRLLVRRRAARVSD